jgi:DNA-binding transcriptional regulator YdaS (Cro superfamily)
MDLRELLRPLTTDELEGFAVRVGTTVGHLRNVAYRQRTASAALAMQIEIESAGVVTRRDLRPRDYMLIWRDLREPDETPAIQEQAERAAHVD